MKEIVQQPDPVLRRQAVEIGNAEFGSAELASILEDMHAALATQHDGVALAAPQIGISKRIFVVAPIAYNKEAVEKPLVFINPKIAKLSSKKSWRNEGCLSCRWYFGKAKRSNKATVVAQDETGKTFTYGGSGLLAQIFQHEVDHLDGVLFIDHAKDLRELTAEEIAQQTQAE